MERIKRALPELLDGLVAVVVGTRDADLRPACARGLAVRVDPSTGRLVLYLSEARTAETLENLRSNGAIAIALDRPETHRSVQVKGRCVDIRPATEEERPVVERFLEGFFEQVIYLGMALSVRSIRAWPCLAVTVEVTEVFEQTPGPRAGEPYRPGGEG